MKAGDKWNEWTVDSLLGEGQFGKVYKLKKTEFGHTYESALKVIRVPQNESELRSVKSEGFDEETIALYFKSVAEEIVSECALMYELKGNSNIVSYEGHQVKELEDSLGWEIFIRMELLTPMTKLMRETQFSEEETIKLGIDICKALEVCHGANIIHRDIKPENVFRSKQGNYKLGDFGIARRMENATTGMSKKGTYAYMAPEVYKGQPYNNTVDIYSLGIMMYRLMNHNRAPLLPLPPEKIIYSDKEKADYRRMSGEVLPPPAEASEDLAEIILKACAYEPKARFSTASEMREKLTELLSRSQKEEVSTTSHPAPVVEEILASEPPAEEPPTVVVRDEVSPPLYTATSKAKIEEKTLTEAPKKAPKVKSKAKTAVVGVLLLVLVLTAGIFINDNIKYKDAELSKDSIEMGRTASRTLKVKNVDDNAKIKWESADPSIASVDENGKITSHKGGVTVVTASLGMGLRKLSCNVRAVQPFIRMESSMHPGNIYTLTLKNTDSQKIKWESDDESVAEITASEEDARIARLEIHRCGFVNITAKVDKDTVECKPEITYEEGIEGPIIELQSDVIETDSDEVTFWVAYSLEHPGDRLAVGWTESARTDYKYNETRGNAEMFTVEDVPIGSSTIEAVAIDSDGHVYDNVERKYITVIRK